jgi:DNA-binding SARP family transcriptional activator
MTKYNEAALLVAAKKLRRLRIEAIGGRKERAARTVGSIIDREGDLKGDDEFVAWVIKNALRYYEEAAQ